MVNKTGARIAEAHTLATVRVEDRQVLTHGSNIFRVQLNDLAWFWGVARNVDLCNSESVIARRSREPSMEGKPRQL